MIIINFVGGIGNQMFLYALYEAIRNRDPKQEVLFDMSRARENTSGIVLDDIFDVVLPKANKRIISNYIECRRNIFAKIRRNIFGKRVDNSYTDLETYYQPNIFEYKDKYLRGYFQSEKYFANFADVIRKRFSFNEKYLSEYQKGILYEIQNSESVSIHIRLGDYLKYSTIYGGICTTAYYASAMKIFDLEDTFFYVFSNDVNLAKKYLKYGHNSRIKFVNTTTEPIRNNMDMYLMSCCKHNIIANSSFSWWGAWLNRNTKKRVVAPYRWLNDRELKDIVPDDWIRIDQKGTIVEKET